MSLNGDRLGLAILSAVEGISLSNPMTPTQKQDIFKAIGNQIVSEITSYAQVTVNVTSVSGVTPGGGISGPGSGTGTVS